MAVNLQEVVKLAETLTEDQKTELVVWLLDKIRTRKLTVDERLAIFDSMSVDLGGLLLDIRIVVKIGTKMLLKVFVDTNVLLRATLPLFPDYAVVKPFLDQYVRHAPHNQCT